MRRLDPLSLTRVVAILFYGRSGSVFLGSLLDGHPQIVATPGCYLNGFYEFWDQFGKLPAYELINAFADYYAVLFDAKNECKSPVCGADAGTDLGFTEMGPERNQCLGVNRDRFRVCMSECLSSCSVVSRRLFLQVVHVAYQEALGRTVQDPTPLIVFPLHTPSLERMGKLVEDFPDTCFLHVVRNPVQTLGSHLACYMKSGLLDTAQAEWIFRGILQGGVSVLPGIRERSRAVRLEDLHNKPKETMEKVCAWLGLEWSDCLLESTFDGKQWWNVKNSPQISGFSQVTLAKKHDNLITPLDRFRLLCLLRDKYRVWQYGPPAWTSSRFIRGLNCLLLLWPFRAERILIGTLLRRGWNGWKEVGRFWIRMRRLFYGSYLTRQREPLLELL